MPTRNRAPRRELLSVAEVAAEADLHPVTIRRLIHQGDLPAYRVGKRGVLKVDRRDLELLIRRVRPGAS